MASGLWGKPLEITIDSGDHFKSIHTSRDALACLMTYWPNKRGKSFALARRACLEAIQGKRDSTSAAEAFETAAREAGLLR